MSSLRFVSRVAVVCVSGLVVSGCASRTPSFDMPLFGSGSSTTTQSVRPQASLVAPSDYVRDRAKAPAVAGYSSERAYYEAYVANGYRHPKGMTRPFAGRSPQPAMQASSAPIPPIQPARAWKGKRAVPGAARVAGKPFQVQDGDTLEWIAQVHNVPVAQLMRVNGLRSQQLHTGQVLVIPDDVDDAPVDVMPVGNAEPALTTFGGTAVVTASARPSAPRAAGRVSGNGQTYIVERGDTFYGIATRHRVDPMELADLNGIDDTSAIRPGQTLRLPKSW